MPFWQQFVRHLTPDGAPNPKVLEELRKRIIETLDETPPNAEIPDPYALEPNRGRLPNSALSTQGKRLKN